MTEAINSCGHITSRCGVVLLTAAYQAINRSLSVGAERNTPCGSHVATLHTPTPTGPLLYLSRAVVPYQINGGRLGCKLTGWVQIFVNCCNQANCFAHFYHPSLFAYLVRINILKNKHFYEINKNLKRLIINKIQIQVK